jgi:hypothetical protein
MKVDREHFLLFNQEQLVLTNLLGTEPVGCFAKVLGKLGHCAQVNPNGNGRIPADLEILLHSLSKWGHDETPFVCDHITIYGSRSGPVLHRCFEPPEA